jgi:hypothetical protein
MPTKNKEYWQNSQNRAYKDLDRRDNIVLTAETNRRTSNRILTQLNLELEKKVI